MGVGRMAAVRVGVGGIVIVAAGTSTGVAGVMEGFAMEVAGIPWQAVNRQMHNKEQVRRRISVPFPGNLAGITITIGCSLSKLLRQRDSSGLVK